MEKKNWENLHKLNCMINDTNAIYHQAALKLGLSDSAMFVLYMLVYKGGSCLLNDICKELGTSKQTINSTVRKLEKDGIVSLCREKGNAKRLYLTEQGKVYAEQTGGRLLAIECSVLAEWGEEEIEQYIRLTEKYNHLLSAQIMEISGGICEP